MAPGELVERPVGRGTEGVFARSGVCFFWLLLCANKEKSPGAQGRSYPQLAFESRAKPARLIYYLDSGFRRNDG